jgi:glycolate oxidase
MDHKRALDRLARLLPRQSLITDETDGLTAISEVPWAVALPETEAQVAAILEICRDCSIAVVPRGAGTGLSGGARPAADGLLLGLSRMNRILEIDLANCAARVEPGVLCPRSVLPDRLLHRRQRG